MAEKLNPPFKGQDLFIVKPRVIAPNDYAHVSVLIREGVIPGKDPLEVKALSSSTRSRVAQMHIELLERVPDMISNYMAGRKITPDQLRHGFVTEVAVRNHANRPIAIDKQAIGRLYREGPPITGEELADLMEDGTIKLEGKNWHKRYRTTHTHSTRDLVGATLKIDSSRRMGVPSGTKPLHLNEVEGVDYRDKIDERLAQLPSSEVTILWVGNTGVELGMPEGVDGVLGKGVYQSRTKRDANSKVGEHINALLLDGGKPAWPIRVEVLGRPIRGLGENFIDVEFRRAAFTPPSPTKMPPNA